MSETTASAPASTERARRLALASGCLLVAFPAILILIRSTEGAPGATLAENLAVIGRFLLVAAACDLLGLILGLWGAASPGPRGWRIAAGALGLLHGWGWILLGSQGALG